MALPAIRARVAADLACRGLRRERVVAAVVRLLDTTLIRVGNEAYAQENDSFGLTTLRNRHVRVEGTRLLFRFRGKSGRQHAVATRDRRLAGLVRRLQELPGQVLFQYVEDDGAPRVVASDDVNEYLGRASEQPFTAKDFRTWAASVLALHALVRHDPPSSEREARRLLKETVEWVAGLLGNTPAVLRRCYLHPAVAEAFQEGRLPEPPGAKPANGLEAAEQALLQLLDRCRSQH
jgi:DNA topoisomerase-1